jgi:hypothetical protein
MILDTTSKSIEVILGAAVVANQAQISASYADIDSATFVPGESDTVSNGTTAVTVVAAPAASKQRQLKYLSVYNADTASITVTVRLNNGGTIRNASSYILSPQQTLQYTPDQGFFVGQPNLANGITPGYIDGLKLITVSATAVSFGSGAAYVQSIGGLVNLPSQFNLTSLALSASTFYHAYLFLSSGVPTVELVTTAPASPYYGTARSKTGDTTRRYLGSFLTDSSGNIFQFSHFGNKILWLATSAAAPFLLLSGGTATSSTPVTCAGAAPLTAKAAVLSILNTSATVDLLLSNSLGPALTANYILFIYRSTASTLDMPLDGSLSYNYAYSSAPTPGVSFHRCIGYTFER